MLLVVLSVFSGLLMVLVGSLMFLIAAFGVSIWWGIFCIFFPPTNLLFLLVNWKVARKAFLVILLGFLLIVAPMVMVENFLADMKHYGSTNFKSYSWSGANTGSGPLALPSANRGADVVGPQSMEGLPKLPDDEAKK